MSAIDNLLAETRAQFNRIEPRPAADAVALGAVLVDIRPAAQRADEGEIPDAFVIERNVLEWRLDPTSPDRIAAVAQPGARIIVFCSEGYASSFAAASLRSLEIDATDLVGGFRGWAASGLPTRPGGAPVEEAAGTARGPSPPRFFGSPHPAGTNNGSVGASDTARFV